MFELKYLVSKVLRITEGTQGYIARRAWSIRELDNSYWPACLRYYHFPRRRVPSRGQLEKGETCCAISRVETWLKGVTWTKTIWETGSSGSKLVAVLMLRRPEIYVVDEGCRLLPPKNHSCLERNVISYILCGKRNSEVDCETKLEPPLHEDMAIKDSKNNMGSIQKSAPSRDMNSLLQTPAVPDRLPLWTSELSRDHMVQPVPRRLSSGSTFTRLRKRTSRAPKYCITSYLLIHS